ncbi:MAG TPA: zf-HC2 domain-containing protein [Terriglobales bacterium]|nr:zf-HC2 domain-containing protein [Terriglobales bacterium]
MKCAEARSLFSPYIDGAVSGTQMRALGQHVDECSSCACEYKLLLKTQNLLARVGRKKAPADLALRLRVAISQEAARARRPSFEGLRVRLENALQAFMVPATAGLLSAVVIFSALMGLFGLPNVQAMSNNDVPLLLYTEPELQSSAFGTTVVGAVNSDSLVIEAYVGADGRIEDYRILSETSNSENLLPQVKRLLIFTTFRPATTLGRPMPGRAVLSFSKVSVTG